MLGQRLGPHQTGWEWRHFQSATQHFLPVLTFYRYVPNSYVGVTRAIYSTNRYRSHWGAELPLQGARLRLSRTYLAAQAPTCQAGMTFGTSSIGFDPADSAQYAAEAAPILGGPPRGQDRY